MLTTIALITLLGDIQMYKIRLSHRANSANLDSKQILRNLRQTRLRDSDGYSLATKVVMLSTKNAKEILRKIYTSKGKIPQLKK